MLSSQKLKKYRLNRTLNMKTGMWRHILKRRSEYLMKGRSRKKRKLSSLLKDIQAFLKRDDNSWTMPGQIIKLKFGKKNFEW